MLVFSGSTHPELSRRICAYIGIKPGLIDIQRFSDGEIFVQFQETIRGKDVFLVQPTATPVNESLMELMIMIDAAKRSSPRRITAVIPYYGYARQDRRTSPRTPISAKLVANLLTEAGADRILTIDLHATQIQGFFDIPVDNLYAAPLFTEDLKRVFPKEPPLIVAPDVGGVLRARAVAKRLNADLAILDKRRDKPGSIEAVTIIGDVKDKDCVIVDDIADSAGTLCKAADELMKAGAKTVRAYISHGVLSGKALENIHSSSFEEVIMTDSINCIEKKKKESKIRILSIAPLVGEAIARIHSGQSVSPLYTMQEPSLIY